MELNELIKKHLRNVVNEQQGGNYMFFSNLEQIKRQCDLLLKLDQNMVNEILDNGHDWADDHISSAKENVDQVFDFLMNESKKGDLNESCWEGYKQVGGKKKNGKMVPNCVPKNKSIKEDSSPAQQAAIAINKKKENENESEREMYEAMEIDESKNCPTDPAKWSASKAAAKRKFDVYPSAYANGWAAKNYKSKGGGWRKCK